MGRDGINTVGAVEVVVDSGGAKVPCRRIIQWTIREAQHRKPRPRDLQDGFSFYYTCASLGLSFPRCFLSGGWDMEEKPFADIRSKQKAPFITL